MIISYVSSKKLTFIKKKPVKTRAPMMMTTMTQAQQQHLQVQHLQHFLPPESLTSGLGLEVKVPLGLGKNESFSLASGPIFDQASKVY